MYLASLKVKNLRSLEDIQVDFDSKVNVIVGPNAAGKTTILEAIRLCKAMLAPRIQNETLQALVSIGAVSPHIPNQLRLQSVARDIEKPVEIGCRFGLSDAEIAIIESEKETIATVIIQSQMGQAFAVPGALIAFLASDQGKHQLELVKSQIQISLDKVKLHKSCYLELKLSQTSGVQAGSDPMEMQFIGHLERRLPPYQSIFTYFPADRALPAGEQPVQLGGQDAVQQLESYNSQPQMKFNRLKNLIFSASILGEDTSGGNDLKSQFAAIFNGILKGRQLDDFGVNEIGLLSVLIKDTEQNRKFDIDGMSSGEKGLILTFLLIARSVVSDGIILFDEPELHLNPAVCKDLLSYLIEEYVLPRNLQVLICSHSPEILGTALSSEDCSLFHIISPTMLSKIRPQDEITIGDALRRLGVSESENLLYKGIIFVEGPDDVSLLEAGFPVILRRFKIKYSSGRKEIEKAITQLQAAENEGVSSPPTYFIFDRDEELTTLTSSKSVRVLQWDRRCLENYLIDLDAISNLLMDEDIARTPFPNAGEVSKLLRGLALRQLDEVAERNVYLRYEFGGVGIRKDDLINKTTDQLSETLLARLIEQKNKLASVDEATWSQKFKAEVDLEKKQLEAVWETKWQHNCDGKRLFEDLRNAFTLKISIKKFKIRLIKEIALNKSETWVTIEGHLHSLINGPH